MNRGWCTRRFIAAAVLLALPSFAGAQEVNRTWPLPSNAKSETINGYPLTYRDEGQGTPIVFIHGSLTDYRTFAPQFSAFVSSYRVISPSLRRFYPEPWNGEGSDFTVEQHAADVAALIRKLNLGKIHLVGWSRGGAVAVEVAKAHPDLIRSLVMEDGSIVLPVEETPESRKAADFTANNIKTLQANLKAGEPQKAAETFIDTIFGPGGWQKLPDAAKQVVLANIYTPLGDLNRPVSTCDDVKKFDFPVLLMTGERSPKNFAFFYGEMRKCKAFPETVVIPSTGHNIHVGNAEAYNKALLGFFQSAEGK